ncbi:RraA family protein [Haloarcula amylovorans]|uniref:RraA family protein n=1 Tax=Haloarcula amylovorans TaxID=2562280 RepID=UPI001FD7EF1B|nr:dimethylmenaquinone methyltransferase [Halomicroarcula amylolytica]
MHRVVSEIDRPPEELVAQFKGIPTPILSDVTSKYENTMASEIEAIPQDVSMAGTAFTVKTYPGDNLMAHKALTMAEAGDVLVIDANAYTEAGLVGELFSTSCRHHGIHGTVIDGAARDVEEIDDLGFPVFARGTSPKGSYKAHPGSINVPISCGELVVEPGDIVIGDNEGVVVVKPHHAEKVLEDAQVKLEEEESTRKRIQDGEYIYDIAGFEQQYNDLDLVEK